MKLLEFLSSCTLKGFVRVHTEIKRPGWDFEAEKYFIVELRGRAYTATIKYATIGDGAAVVHCALDDHGHRFPDGRHGTKTFLGAELKDVVAAFIPK